MEREILELQNDTTILRKNGSFGNKACFSLTALFVKTKIYFYRCKFAQIQIQKLLVSLFLYRL